MTNLHDNFMSSKILEESIKVRPPVTGQHDNEFGYKYHLYDILEAQKSVWIRFNSNYVVYSADTQFEAMVPETYYQYGDIETYNNKSYFNPRYCGIYPHAYKTYMESGVMMVNFTNSPDRIAPSEQSFAYEWPYDETYWDIPYDAIYWNKSPDETKFRKPKWGDSMSQRYDFFGLEFFKNEIDKLRILSNGKNYG